MLGRIGIAVFLRYPERGRVKTRLAATVGPDRALEIYEKLLSRTLETLDALPEPFVPTLFGEPSVPLEKYRARFADGRRRFALQEGPDLGERLYLAARTVLQEESAVLCVGTDCPEIRPEHFVAAAEALRSHDAVLGPAKDGGYWLLGTKRAERRLFEQIPWSTNRVAALTESRFRELRWTWAALPTLSDIDEAADAERFGL